MDDADEHALVQRYLEYKRPKIVPSGRCPYCRRAMNQPNDLTSRKSRDHILPRTWGGRDKMWPDEQGGFSTNVRTMCAQCNSHRAHVGHCVGAMACIQAVCRDDLQDYRTICRRWGMGKIEVRNPRREAKRCGKSI